MSNKNQKTMTELKKSAFEYFTEIVGWIQIFASPFLIGLIISIVVYFSNPSKLTFAFSICISAIGLIIGAVWATRAWRSKGTIHFMSRISATQDLKDRNSD